MHRLTLFFNPFSVLQTTLDKISFVVLGLSSVLDLASIYDPVSIPLPIFRLDSGLGSKIPVLPPNLCSLVLSTSILGLGVLGYFWQFRFICSIV